MFYVQKNLDCVATLQLFISLFFLGSLINFLDADNFRVEKILNSDSLPSIYL